MALLTLNLISYPLFLKFQPYTSNCIFLIYIIISLTFLAFFFLQRKHSYCMVHFSFKTTLNHLNLKKKNDQFSTPFQSGLGICAPLSWQSTVFSTYFHHNHVFVHFISYTKSLEDADKVVFIAFALSIQWMLFRDS